MKVANLVFPHQLYAKSPLLENGGHIYLIEEYLFFKQYAFHKQKIAFHRATMKAYQQYLQSKNITVYYVDAENPLADIRQFSQEIKQENIGKIHVIEVTDDYLNQRIQALPCKVETYDNPQFLQSKEDLKGFFRADKTSFFQTTFYKQQRKKLGVLLDADGRPEGGQWTFDKENRKKYPKGKVPPMVHFPRRHALWDEACAYTNLHFSENPGTLSKNRLYPITHQEANEWFEQFLAYRFHEFGAYEDAMVNDASILHHSVLSPLMNVGLLLPDQMVKRALSFAKQEGVPINSTEGFVRQIIGWREFIRGMYECKGRYSRTRNFWRFKRSIPPCFYDGTTGIDPIDATIKKVLKTGYCHHIERLMVLGNFMLLCEFHPNAVYQWFMELFIDAYDWVMVPNVYGMALFADGGTFATKPYISGSNYIKKMSNYPNGEWQAIWDAMFWRFVHKHEKFFKANPRTAMLVHTLNRMSAEKRERHRANAERFINRMLEPST